MNRAALIIISLFFIISLALFLLGVWLNCVSQLVAHMFI
jgi:hypothetical protein